MDAVSWLGLEATDDPLRFQLPVRPRLSTGGGFLFGGAGLAAATAALEVATGRPLVWASAQYLSYARPPAVLDIEVALAVTGHQISQARATGRVDDVEIFTVNAALGPPAVRGGRVVGRAPRGAPPRRVPRASPRPPPRRHHHEHHRDAPGRGPPDGGPRRGAGERPLGRLGPGARPRHLGRDPRRARRLGARSGSGRRSGPGPGATASTTACGWWTSSPPSGCCSTSGSRPWPTASATGSSTCGPRTGRCWPPPASPPSSATGRARGRPGGGPHPGGSVRPCPLRPRPGVPG